LFICIYGYYNNLQLKVNKNNKINFNQFFQKKYLL
jgi:hypothetical protein